jgi:hypothetical protein
MAFVSAAEVASVVKSINGARDVPSAIAACRSLREKSGIRCPAFAQPIDTSLLTAAVDALVGALKRHVTDAGVVEEACESLYVVLSLRTKTQGVSAVDACGERGVWDALGTALQHHGLAVDTTASAEVCRVMDHLVCKGAETPSALEPLLVGALDWHIADAALAARLCHILAYTPNFTKRKVAAAMRAASRHPSDPDVIIAAARSLTVPVGGALDDGAMGAVLAAGSPKRFVDALVRFHDCDDVAWALCDALAVIVGASYHSDMRGTALAKETAAAVNDTPGAVRALVSIAKRLRTESDIVLPAVAVLAELAHAHGASSDIVAEGGVSAAVGVLGEYGPRSKKPSLGFRYNVFAIFWEAAELLGSVVDADGGAKAVVLEGAAATLAAALPHVPSCSGALPAMRKVLREASAWMAAVASEEARSQPPAKRQRTGSSGSM